MATKTAKVRAKSDRDRPPDIEVNDPVPSFASEREEAEYWDNHNLGESYFAAAWPEDPRLPPPGQVRASHPTSIRLDANTVSRLRSLADLKEKGYQTLLKEFVLERLYEEEKREGILPACEAQRGSQ